jgi:restriction endonuclease S subunit
LLIIGFKFLELEFYFPKKQEQQKIANTLSTLDNLIEAQNQQINHLKQHKKGLPFRDAHEVVGLSVAYGLKIQKDLSELNLEEFSRIAFLSRVIHIVTLCLNGWHHIGEYA